VAMLDRLSRSGGKGGSTVEELKNEWLHDFDIQIEEDYGEDFEVL
jgi:hypothetical protein